MLVLLVLDLVVRFLERLDAVALALLGELADQLPVEVVLHLRVGDGLAGDDLGGLGRGDLARAVHQRHQRFALHAHELAPGRVRLGIGHPGHKDRVPGHVLSDFHKSDAEWLEPLLEAIGDNADLLVKGDDNGFMNKLAIALGSDGTERPRRPPQQEQSHLGAARRPEPQAKPPETGPMAAMLKKLFGDKNT